MVRAARPQQLGPGFGAVGAVFGQEDVMAAAFGLPIERAKGIPTDEDRAIEAGGEGFGLVRAARPQQLGPGFGAIGAVFSQEGVVVATVVGLPIERTTGPATDEDRAIEAGGEGACIVIAARPQQLGPGFGAVSAVSAGSKNQHHPRVWMHWQMYEPPARFPLLLESAGASQYGS